MKKSSITVADILIFENEDYFLVNKPPYLSTLNDRVEKVNLLALAKEFAI